SKPWSRRRCTSASDTWPRSSTSLSAKASAAAVAGSSDCPAWARAMSSALAPALRPSSVCAARQYSQRLRSAIATAISSPRRGDRLPAPRAPNAPHIARSAAGELATARNMLGVAPNAPWMSSSRAVRSALAAAGSTRGSLDMAVVSVAGRGMRRGGQSVAPAHPIGYDSAIFQCRSDAMSLDRLEAVLRRFHVGVELFHTGPLCGSESFDSRPGRGFLHLLRSGAMEVRHAVPGLPRVQRIDEPTLLFYPAGHAHRFLPAGDGPAPVLTCAALHFDGGPQHPLVAGLPALVALPLREVGGLEASLALLFDEADQVRCGHRVLADRLLE